MLTMAPGGCSGLFLALPRGEKFTLLVQGEVMLTLGDQGHILRTGDAITFVPTTPHHWENRSAGPAQVVLVTLRVLP
jgi:uncharacterized cupin superfamily protein